MHHLHALFLAATAFLASACTTPAPPTADGNGNGNGDTTGNGGTTGDGDTNNNGGGTGGRCKATGPICPSFTSGKGWAFTTATSYSEGAEPNVSAMAGTAVFNADGTFVEDYTVGSVGFQNHYEGTYTLDGRAFTGTTTEGETLEYILACDEAQKGLAITFPKEDCSPSLILGLKLIE